MLGGKLMSSKELIKLLEKNGWQNVRTRGSHNHFKHPNIDYLITVPHPKRDIPKGTANKILKQAGLK